jgi:poly(3-hydroxybutyrate) depolymerase
VVVWVRVEIMGSQKCRTVLCHRPREGAEEAAAVTSTHGSRNDPSKYEMWTVPHVLALWASGKRAIILCVAPVQIDKLLWSGESQFFK